MLEEKRDERVVVERQRHHAQAQSPCEHCSVATRVARAEKMDLGAGHQRRSDERIRTGFFIITIDEGDSWPHATQRVTRRLGMPRKVRCVSSEFHRGAQ